MKPLLKIVPGALVGYAALRLDDDGAMLPHAIGGLAGAFVGYLVLRDARRERVEGLGEYGALACLVAGTIGGMIGAVPVSLVFVFLIRRRSRTEADV